VLADLAVLVVVVGIGVGIAEAVDWQGSRSFRLQFFGVVTFGLVGGYVAMIVWKGAHEGGRVRRSRRHARRGRRSSRHSH
jgi:hypothetical protein